MVRVPYYVLGQGQEEVIPDQYHGCVWRVIQWGSLAHLQSRYQLHSAGTEVAMFGVSHLLSGCWTMERGD